MTVYAAMDVQVARFRAETGRDCPEACGACCTSEKIEASVTEMLPAAVELVGRGLTRQWLTRLEGDGGAGAGVGPCVFYQSDPGDAGHGRCTIYTWRPTLCRLFGFAAVRTKRGSRVLAVCRHMARQPTMEPSRPAPCFSDWTARINGLDNPASSLLLPINAAAFQALHRAALAAQLAHAASGTPARGPGRLPERRCVA